MEIEEVLRKQTAEHLWDIGNFLSSSCPPASRFHMCTLERKLNEFPDLLKKASKMYCRHCGSIWNSENCRIRIRSRQRKNQHMTKLQKLEASEPWKLNKHQRQKLRKFQDSRSKIVYDCFSCKKKTIFEGSKSRNVKYETTDGFCRSAYDNIKLNKEDLNAGLFIPLPASNEKNHLEKLQVPESKSILETSQKSFSKCEDKTNPVKIQTPSSLKFQPEASSNSQKKSTGKKKKTLLGQIVNEEQNSKKRISLSSFLTSL